MKLLELVNWLLRTKLGVGQFVTIKISCVGQPVFNSVGA